MFRLTFFNFVNTTLLTFKSVGTLGWVNLYKNLKLKNTQFVVNSFYPKMERHFL